MKRESVVQIPRTVALLGELGDCALRDPRTGAFYGMDYVPGRLLCATEDGRQMFVIKPLRDAGPPRADAHALRVLELYERFSHRDGDGFYNCFIPPFVRHPKFAGEMAIITYLIEKGEDAEEMDDTGEDFDPEYVHYFEQEGAEPAYAGFYNLGHDQFFFPRGRWRVAADGIEYADD